MLPSMVRRIDENLGIFLQRLRTVYRIDAAAPALYEALRTFLLRKGKRLRPLLLILSYQGYREASAPRRPSIYYVSSCIELLHNFMLIHDDIIDRSDLRRGQPALHKLLTRAASPRPDEQLGKDLGIVAGDIVYALAFDAFLSIREDPRRKEEALQYFIQTAIQTATGEFIDTLLGARSIRSVREEDIVLNHTLKTAHYTFICPLVVGAILAGAEARETRLLSLWGSLVGQAFQIQDDVIGIFDSEANTGKTSLSDLEEGKKTLLVWHAFHHLPVEKRRRLVRIFDKRRKDAEDLRAVQRLFREAGSLDHSLEEIRRRIAEAEAVLARLKMRPRSRRLLRELLRRLFAPSVRFGLPPVGSFLKSDARPVHRGAASRGRSASRESRGVPAGPVRRTSR